MDLSAFELAIIRANGSQGNVFKTNEDQITIGQHVHRDIRIKIPEAEPLMCKITADPIQKGRVRLTNYSQSNPIKVNGSAVKDKMYIKHMDEIDVAGKRFIWRNINKKNAAVTPGTSNQLSVPQSVPHTNKSGLRDSLFAAARIVKKRFTFATTNEEANLTEKLEDKPLRKDDDEHMIENIDDKTELIMPTTPLSTPIVNKENRTPATELNLSGILYVSCTPHAVIDTGLRKRKSTLRVPDTPSEPYGTPKSVLSEFNNETLTSTSHRYTPKPSMHFIDFTTPHLNRSKYLSPTKSNDQQSQGKYCAGVSGYSTPVVKSSAKKGLLRSALKNSAVKVNANQLKKKLSLAFEQQKSGDKSPSKASQEMTTTVQAQSPNLMGIQELMVTSRPTVSNTSEIMEEITELSTSLKPTDDILEENITLDAFDKLVGKTPIKHTYQRKSQSVTPEKSNIDSTLEPDVADWVDSVMAANTLSNEEVEMQPNEKSQILSNRFSDITNDSMQNMTGRSSFCYSLGTSMLGVSPISKINVTDEGIVETLTSFTLHEEMTDVTDASLRSTRKRIRQALTSLNTSRLSEIDQNDESVLVQNEMFPIYEEPEDNQVEYANLEAPCIKDDIVNDLDLLETLNSPNKNLEMANLSEAPTNKNKKIGFTTPQRPVRQARNLRNTVASKRDLPDREIDRQYMLQQNLAMRLKKTDEERSEISHTVSDASQLKNQAPKLAKYSETPVDSTYELDDSDKRRLSSSSQSMQNHTFTMSPLNKTNESASESLVVNKSTDIEKKESHEETSQERRSTRSTSSPPYTKVCTAEPLTEAPKSLVLPTKQTEIHLEVEDASNICNAELEIAASVYNSTSILADNIVIHEALDKSSEVQLDDLEMKNTSVNIETTISPEATNDTEALILTNQSPQVLPCQKSVEAPPDTAELIVHASDPVMSPEKITKTTAVIDSFPEKIEEATNTGDLPGISKELEPTDHTNVGEEEPPVTAMKTADDVVTKVDNVVSDNLSISEGHEKSSDIENITLNSTLDESYTCSESNFVANKTPPIIETIVIPDTPATFIMPRPPRPHYVGTPRPRFNERDSVICVDNNHSTPIRSSVILIEDTPITKPNASRFRNSSIVYEPNETVNHTVVSDDQINETLEDSMESLIEDEGETKKLDVQIEMQSMEENPTKALTTEFKTPQLLRRRTPRTPKTVSSLKDLNGIELSPLFEQEITDIAERDSELKNMRNTPKRGVADLLTPQPIRRRNSRNGNTRISELADYKDQTLRPEVASEIVGQRDARRALALMKEEMENMDTMPKLSNKLFTPQNQIKTTVNTPKTISNSEELKSVVIRETFLDGLKSTNEAQSLSDSVSHTTESDREVEEILVVSTEKVATKRKLYTPNDDTPKPVDGSIRPEQVRQAYIEESIEKEKVKHSRKGIIKNDVKMGNEADFQKNVGFENDTQASDSFNETEANAQISKQSQIERNLSKINSKVKGGNTDSESTNDEAENIAVEEVKPLGRQRKRPIKLGAPTEDTAPTRRGRQPKVVVENINVSIKIEKPVVKRGRKKKTENVENKESSNESRETDKSKSIRDNTDETQPVKGGRVKTVEKVDEVKAETNSGRQKKVEKAEDTTTKTSNEGTELSDTEVVQPRAKRGLSKKELNDANEPLNVKESWEKPVKRGRKKKAVKTESETSETEAEKPQQKRARTKKVDPTKQPEDVTEIHGEKDNKEQKLPTRGRKVHKQEETLSAVSPKKSKRGRAKAAPETTPKNTSVDQSTANESVSRPKRGRRPAAASVTVLTNESTKESTVTEKPRRGRKPKQATTNDFDEAEIRKFNEAPASTPLPSKARKVSKNGNESEVETPKTMRTRGKRLMSKDTNESVTPKPKQTRARKGKVETETATGSKVVTRRGRKINDSVAEPASSKYKSVVVESSLEVKNHQKATQGSGKKVNHGDTSNESVKNPGNERNVRKNARKRKSSEAENENQNDNSKRVKEDTVVSKRTTRPRK